MIKFVHYFHRKVAALQDPGNGILPSRSHPQIDVRSGNADKTRYRQTGYADARRGDSGGRLWGRRRFRQHSREEKQ